MFTQIIITVIAYTMFIQVFIGQITLGLYINQILYKVTKKPIKYTNNLFSILMNSGGTELTNYRMNKLSPIISRVAEKVIRNKRNELFMERQLFLDHQYAFHYGNSIE